MSEASQAEKNTFGAAVKLHPITRRPLENGIGALSEDRQAELHLAVIEREEGKEAAERVRKALHPEPVKETASNGDDDNRPNPRPNLKPVTG